MKYSTQIHSTNIQDIKFKTYQHIQAPVISFNSLAPEWLMSRLTFRMTFGKRDRRPAIRSSPP